MSTLRANNLESLETGRVLEIDSLVENQEVGDIAGIRVTSIAAIEAYSAPVGYVFSLNDGGRSGTFDVVAGDFSTELAADTLNGIYVGQANDPTAATKVAKRRYDGVISALWFGAGGAETEANNRTFLQSTIALLDFLGGGTCVMPYEAPYGLENDDATTFPDFTGVTSDLLVIDRSEASANGVEKAGFQERRFSHTAQTDPVGQHNGNGLRQFGDWAPYFWSENTAQYAAKGDGSRTAADNRRSSIFFATNGVANWRVGQGNFSGDLSEAEMSAFVIAVNGIPDLSITGLASAFVINKDNGNIGFNVADPGLPYLFAMRPGQTNAFKVQGDSDGGSLRIILDKGDGNENEVLVDSAGETRFIHNGETVARITAAGTLTSIKSIGGGAFTTTERNALGVLPAGVMVFDTTLSKPIWKPVTGTASWVDATGATV